MTRANLAGAGVLGLLLAGSIALQVSTRNDVSDLGNRVTKVERVVACEERQDCRAFVRRVVLSLLDSTQNTRSPVRSPQNGSQRVSVGGGEPSTPPASSPPSPPPSGGGGNNGGGNPPADPSPLTPVCDLAPVACDLLP